MDPAELNLWKALLWGYPITVALEAPILLTALAPRHGWRQRWFASCWLTACSYPIVVIVLPILMAGSSRLAYLAVAETFAPLSECLLFYAAFPNLSGDRAIAGEAAVDGGATGRFGSTTWRRDGLAIIAANLVSFLSGEIWWSLH